MKIYKKPQLEMTIIRNQDFISISGSPDAQPKILPASADNISGYKS